jgi:hypothetical protein
MSDELDVLFSKTALFNMADGQLGVSNMGSERATRHGKYYLMDDDPRLLKKNAGEADASRLFRVPRQGKKSYAAKRDPCAEGSNYMGSGGIFASFSLSVGRGIMARRARVDY